MEVSAVVVVLIGVLLLVDMLFIIAFCQAAARAQE